ncbi:hypothetical protein AB3S75_021604 [Citrus x aurantiifolia]
MALPNSLVFNIAFSVSSIPSNYIRPASNRLNLDGVYLDDCIPQIDLRCLNGSNRSDVVKQTGQACQDYGFFQIENNGNPEEVMDEVLCLSRQFFHLPE